MLFNSVQFLWFFPLVVVLYFALPQRLRWVMLLAASYYFYMCWKAEYIILIVASTLIDYFAGVRMGRFKTRKPRRKYLILSLLSNLGLLFAFKYFNFFNESTRALFAHFNLFYNVPAFRMLLPVGISFYTFQTLSYSIDVYRGDRDPERHIGIFALYVAFFPQLVAGPIERSTRLLPQFFEKHRFDYHMAVGGLRLILWGFFKKVVIADRLAIFVDQVYTYPETYKGITVLIATYFFAFQIYCDFSGYSDIAIGTAQVMGYRLMRNFHHPYFSQSIAEFWKRWHISLSTWFRDYLYIPMGGNRVVRWRWHFNLFFVFLVSGLWHGANWTFVVWGALHGFYLIFSLHTQKLRDRMADLSGINHVPGLRPVLRGLITFHLVVFAWIFFRASSLDAAFLMIRNLFTSGGTGFYLGPNIFSTTELVLSISAVVFMEIMHVLEGRGDVRDAFGRWPMPVRWALYIAITLCIMNLGATRETPFIYFQF